MTSAPAIHPDAAGGEFQILAEFLDQVLWVLSVPDRRLLYVSPSYARLWGLPMEDLLRDPRAYLAAVHADDRGRVDGAMQAVLAGAPQVVEYRILQPDGSERWVSSRAFPVVAEGEVMRVAGVTEDVTTRRRAEAERERLLEIVSHDLSSPITALQLYAHMALTDAERGDAAATLAPLRSLMRCTEQMQRLVTDLLQAASLEAGSVRLAPRDCLARDLVDEAVHRAHPLAAARGQTLDCTVEPGTCVRADPERIQQVFANLLGNAVRFAPEGGRIGIHVEGREAGIWFSIEDNGPGISDDEIPHLFGRYWQGLRHGGGGAGLGLAIARGMVEAHGGRIWVTSQPGQGSTFIFSLPPCGAHRP